MSKFTPNSAWRIHREFTGCSFPRVKDNQKFIKFFFSRQCLKEKSKNLLEIKGVENFLVSQN